MRTTERDLQLWGGVECTINRVGERYFDQYERAGHRTRLAEDFERIAALGLKTLRVGLHWERFAATRSWESFDAMLAEMKRQDLTPIAGLLHHGSGPVETDLLDPAFPEKLANYALAVATRYPWLTEYTPVNEPHTTSRFSCLYGHWYPHHRSVRSYLRALLNQIKGIVLAMSAIRTVQPGARLIHTEDAGQTFSTPQLEAYRVEREHRRWLGTDLLCGLVTREHPLFRYLVENEIPPEEILWFSEHACPPSVLGLNHYVTSDRFLDHRLGLYPPHLPGGDSGDEPLVDIEAVRVREQGIATTETILGEAWERYRLPLAITEAHLGGESDDQIRWLDEVWEGAKAAKANGIDVRAVTVWALLGSWNWSCLCTEDVGDHEVGVIDYRRSKRELTELAEVVRQLSTSGRAQHPALEHRGWWRNSERLTLPPYRAEDVMSSLCETVTA